MLAKLAVDDVLPESATFDRQGCSTPQERLPESGANSQHPDLEARWPSSSERVIEKLAGVSVIMIMTWLRDVFEIGLRTDQTLSARA